jgi:rod shape-determining protein MreC
MEVIHRHRNLTIFLIVLVAQVVGLAVQVRRPTDRGSTRLIRFWAISLVTPVGHAMVHTQGWVSEVWRNYFYLRGVRQENQRLQQENLRLRLEQVRMAEDAGQAQRLQALLRFKEQFISETVAAQVIGSSGSETSRLVYVDKGSRDGIKPDMAVITPAGVVGKVIRVFPATAQVLEINDQSSGIGAMLAKSRLQGILKGTPAGEIMVHYVMAEEKVDPGEAVVTSGGDRIFPKGLPIGRVVQVSPGAETFLNIRVRAAAPLDRIEEVLIITKVNEQQRELLPEAPRRAADILALRLPSISVKPPEANPANPASPGAPPFSGAAPTGAAPASPPTAGTAVAPPKPQATALPKTAGTTNGTAAAGAKPADHNGDQRRTGAATETPKAGSSPLPTTVKPATAGDSGNGTSGNSTHASAPSGGVGHTPGNNGARGISNSQPPKANVVESKPVEPKQDTPTKENPQ